MDLLALNTILLFTSGGKNFFAKEKTNDHCESSSAVIKHMRPGPK